MKKRLLFFLLALLLPLFSLAEGQLHVLFANAGDGDTSIIRLHGKTYVIDTGRKLDIPKLYAALAALQVQEVEALFLSHSHQDHVGGIAALKDKADIKRVYCAEIGEADKKGRHKTAKASEKAGLKPHFLKYRDKIEIADGAYFEVLGPIVKDDLDDNDNSLVLMLHAFGKKVLFAGDMQFAEEESLLARAVDVSCDVLKVGNHGNSDATSEAFAKACMPKYAFISTDTQIDHNSANPRVLRALGKAEIYITENSDIGYLYEISNGNEAVFSLGKKETPIKSLQLLHTGRDLYIKAEEEVNVRSCFLFAKNKGLFLNIKDDVILKKGEKRSVAAFPEGEAWLKALLKGKKQDEVRLYDAFGNVLANLAIKPFSK